MSNRYNQSRLMKNLFPEKSPLGLPLLTSFQSTISAYFLLITLVIIKPFFGDQAIQLKAGYCFFILLYLSTIILICNSIQQRKRRKSFYWILINLPLWIAITFQFKYLIGGIKVVQL